MLSCQVKWKQTKKFLTKGKKHIFHGFQKQKSKFLKICSFQKFRIAYFGITKKLDLLSREASLLLKGILEKMASNERIYVYAHLSTPCSAVVALGTCVSQRT